jgi:ribosomal protein L28
MLSRLDEEYVLRQVCRRAWGARTRTFTLSARGLRIDRNGVLIKILQRLEDVAGIKIVVVKLSNGKKAKYVVDASALRVACRGLC